jgi:pimeloyl-ACP methyl ester carboxylesterase
MQQLLLLHGAVGASSQLADLAESLGDRYRVYTHDFTGHGGRPFPDSPFSMDLFVADVLEFMDHERLDNVSIFGYSMGGYVAMCLAKRYPQRVKKIITLATKYHWDEAIAAREIQMLDPVKIEQKVPAFAAALAERHAPNDWKQVLKHTSGMMVGMGADNPLKMDDYPVISTPSLIMLGDQDKMVSLDETVAVYKALPKAQLSILPGTPHPLEHVDVHLLHHMVDRFLCSN